VGKQSSGISEKFNFFSGKVKVGMKTRKYRVCVVDRQKKIDKEMEKDRAGFG
jgi:hypothetical protein